MVAAVVACTSADDRQRIEALEIKVGALERYATKNEPPVTRTRTKQEAFDELVASPVIKNLWDADQQQTFRLLRIEGLLSAFSDGARGWWCDPETLCGRTRKECVELLEMIMTTDGSTLPASRCIKARTAWCRSSQQIECTMRKIKDYKEYE